MYHIMGLGRSGQSVALYLHSQDIPFTVSDDCPSHLGHIQKKYPWMMASIPDSSCTIVVSPGIESSHPFLKNALSCKQGIVSDVDLFFRFFPKTKAVCLTGSVGKTTSCHLVHSALQKQNIASVCAGNIGIPLFSTIKDGQPFDGLYILEISSYQLEWIEHLPVEVAVLLNLSEQHLDRHGTMDHYRQLKEKTFRHAKVKYANTHWVDNWGHDFPTVKAYDRHLQRHDESKGLSSFIQREHNQSNQHAAQCILSALKCRSDGTLFQDFQGLEHRQEYVGSWKGVHYVNDSKATSPSSVQSALACMPSPVFWIAGGILQQDSLDLLKPYLHGVQKAWLIGQSAQRYADFLKENNIPFQHSSSLEDAVRSATVFACSTGGIVLLSPGCASFDQFNHFQHRGHAFKSTVEKIKKNGIESKIA